MKLDKEMQKLKIKQLERKLRDEEAINMRTFNFKKGAYVEYGNTIQLLHVQSQCFIQGSKTCADEDNSCNKIELAVHGGKHVQFVAQGGFKYKQEGDKIHYNDQILLYHPKTKLYLHVTERLLKIEEQSLSHSALDEQQRQRQAKLELGIEEITPKKIDRRAPPSHYAPYYEVNVSNVKTKFTV